MIGALPDVIKTSTQEQRPVEITRCAAAEVPSGGAERGRCAAAVVVRAGIDARSFVHDDAACLAGHRRFEKRSHVVHSAIVMRRRGVQP